MLEVGRNFFCFKKLEKRVTSCNRTERYSFSFSVRQQIKMEDNQKKQDIPQSVSKEDPGLMESIGTFPVWMLKVVDVITPDFLIKKSPPSKK